MTTNGMRTTNDQPLAQTAEKLNDKASDVASQAKTQAKDVAQQAQAQAFTAIDEGKSQVAGQLNSVAQAFRSTSKQLRNQDQGGFAQYSEQMAAQVDRAASYLEQHSPEELLRDAEQFARRQPELFLGGAFTVGLLIARFMKSSERRRYGRYEQAQYQMEPRARAYTTTTARQGGRS